MDEQDLIFNCRNKKKIIILNGKEKFQIVDCLKENLRVYFHGEIYGTSLQNLKDSIVEKNANFGNLFGRFIILIHDLAKEELSIHNDRYGLIPFYEYSTEQEKYYSFQIKDLLQKNIAKKELNYSSLSDLLAFCVPLEHKTLIQNVHSYKEGTCTKFDLKSMDSEQQSNWDIIKLMKGERLSFSKEKDTLLSIFEEGYTKTIMDDKINITFSAGVDSRCLFALALFSYEKEKISNYNISVPGSRSQMYSKKISEIFKVNYSGIELGAQFSSQYYLILKEIVALTEGMTFASEVEGTYLRNHVNKGKNSVMLHGAFGELSKIYKMHHFFIEKNLEKKDRSYLIERLWSRFETRFNKIISIFSDEFQKQIAHAAKQNLTQKITSIDTSLSNYDTLMLCYIQEYLERITKYSMSIWNDKIKTILPFSYPQYVDFLLQLRKPDIMKAKFQIELLRRTNKTLFLFPDSNTGTRIGSSKIWNEAVHVYSWLEKKILGSQTMKEHSDPVYWLKNIQPSIEEILLTHCDESIYKKEQLLKFIQNAKNGCIYTACSLQKILLFEIWRKEFLV